MADNCQNPDTLFRFAVIADSHMRLESREAGESEGGYPSNRVATARNRYVVDCINRLQPDFVIHLGDIVHPIPALASHEQAVELARDVYAGLEAELYALPGNHDIGDKPNAWMPAPVVDEQSHRIFEKHWGALYRSFDHRDCHFVLLDTPVMNSGLAREREQQAWLEDDLARNRAAGRRLFVCTHYPLFLYQPDEPRHYDNLDEPARSWLLNLLDDHSAEAVFSGHVHNFFFNRAGATLHYILPSTAFVRPEYAELAAVAPGNEFGRDDGGKLGFFMVQVRAQGHAIDPIRTHGFSGGAGSPAPGAAEATPGASRIGVTLRHPWAEPVQLPSDGLDEFTRKKARNDTVIQALWELGTKKIRVPLADLAAEQGRRRMADLAATGMAFTVFSIGIPDEETIALIEDHSSLVSAWEVIAPRGQLAAAMDRLAGLRCRREVSLVVAPVTPLEPQNPEAVTFQHFASHGFGPEEGDLALKESVDGVTFRVSPVQAPWDGIAAMAAWAAETGLGVLANVQLPRRNEGVAFDDDAALANHAAETVAAAMAHPAVGVFMDTFMDHDRGYYPRHGLIDRRSNPRPAFHAIKNLESILARRQPGGIKERKVSVLEKAEGRRAFYLHSRTQGAVLHLVGQARENAPLTFRLPDGARGSTRGNAKTGQYVDLQSGGAIPFDAETSPEGTFIIRPRTMTGDAPLGPGPRLLILEP